MPHCEAAMAEQRRRASISTSRGGVAWATRNSSPPTRAASPLDPTTSRILVATSTITRSPTAWPWVSFIRLKPSRSIITTLNDAAPVRAASEMSAWADRRKPRRFARPVSGSVDTASFHSSRTRICPPTGTVIRPPPASSSVATASGTSPLTPTRTAHATSVPSATTTLSTSSRGLWKDATYAASPTKAQHVRRPACGSAVVAATTAMPTLPAMENTADCTRLGQRTA